MTKNMGSTDRIVRASLAVALLVVAAVAGLGSIVGIIALVFAAVMADTSAAGFCPLFCAAAPQHRPFPLTYCQTR